MNSFSEKLLKSLLTQTSPGGSVEDILAWIKSRNQQTSVTIRKVPFSELLHWHFDAISGNLCHDTGRFFSIEGLRVMVNDGELRDWTQPIINQPEIGILGILTKEIDGILCFLLQAKIEPGNVNHVQLSPTLQATRSNYTQIHRGRKPSYLEYFQNATRSQIILDQLQSEQGAQFFRKRNRNIILEIKEEVPLTPDYRWLSLGQIKALLNHNNVVNMDTRTVISGLQFHAFIKNLSVFDLNAVMNSYRLSQIGRDLFVSETSLAGCHTIDEILFWLSHLKSKYELLVDRIPLHNVTDWQIGEFEIARPDRRYFRVIGVDVLIENREVNTWCQPIVEPMQQGMSAFIIKKINSVYHFLVQAKIECGNFDVVEMAPTVQCLTGNYRDGYLYTPRFLDYVLSDAWKRALVDTMQSEEGGRFYHEQNRNMIVEASDDFSDKVPPNYIWVTLGQMKEFLRFNNYLNIQARSLIAALNYY